MDLRTLTPEDREASYALGLGAFGAQPPDDAPFPTPGSEPFGVFVGGRLVAKATARRYDSWFHGCRVPTVGVGGVVVAPEHRGAGLLRPMMEQVWRRGRDWGAVVSTLFPSAPGIYRGLGYEVIAELTEVEVPTSALRPAAAGEVTLRRAGADDLPAVMDCYDRWAVTRNGPLTRRGDSFPVDAEAWLRECTAVTLAQRGSTITGYAAWSRSGPGPTGVIDVHDLVWSDAAARDALVGALGSFASIAQTVRVRTSGGHEIDLVTRGALPQVRDRSPYMLTVLDVPAAVELLSAPPGLSGGTVFAVATGDDPAGDDPAGARAADDPRPGGPAYRLDVGDGRVRCVATDAEPAVRLTRRGLALLWSGALPMRSVVAAGLAEGDPDPVWDALGLHRPLHVLDHF